MLKGVAIKVAKSIGKKKAKDVWVIKPELDAQRKK
jgi:hypothetical protein